MRVVSEEYHPDATPQGLSVVIDPIDGTCNFAAGIPMFGVQMAVMEDALCQGAVLYLPCTKQLFRARLGKGATCNGSPLRVNTSAVPADGVLLISDYYGNIQIPMDRQFSLVQSLQSIFLKTRHLGAACIDFTTLAQGQALGYVTYYHKLWDIAPGLLLCKEAGCVCGAVDAPTYEYGKPGLVVANSEATLKCILDAAR